MMDKMDDLIKGYFEGRAGISGRRQEGLYPSSEILVAYLSDGLRGQELEHMLDFLKNNPDAQDLVSKARELMDAESGWENEDVPVALVDKAKALMSEKNPRGSCPHCGKAITPFKKGLPPQKWKNALWLTLAIVSFGLSFKIPHYFYQCLAAALFFGFKWAVEQRAAKTQILIYKALSDDPAAEHQRLHRHSSRL